MRKRWSWFAASLLILGLCGGAAAEEAPDFPPAGAPAVVLSRKAELLMLGYGTDLRSISRLKVSERVKILNAEGRSHGEVLIRHSRRVHLENLQGTTTQRERVEALYRFVRDRISTQESDDVLLPDGSSVQDVLAMKRGEAPEKALLLQSMLRALGVKARLVWAADRANGLIDIQLANPGWFDTVLVAADVDGRRLYLDPSAPSLEPGQLQPGYEGTTAVVLSLDPEKDPRATETVVLPARQAEKNDVEALVLVRR